MRSTEIRSIVTSRMRLTQERAAPVDEAMVSRYETDHDGWNVRYFHGFYREDGGTRSYSWVKNRLQAHWKVGRGKGLREAPEAA